MPRNKQISSIWEKIACIIIVIGVLTIIYFMCCSPFNDGSKVRNPELFGLFGDFIGGFVGSLFAIVSIILLYATLKAQRMAMNSQNEDIAFQHRLLSQERFETTFFNLLEFQQQILNNIRIKYLYITDNFNEGMIEEEGVNAFQFILKDFRHIEESLKTKSYCGKYDAEKKEWEEEIAYIYEEYPPEHEYDRRAEIEKDRVWNTVSRQYTNSIFGINQEHWRQAHARTGKHLLATTYYFLCKKYHNATGHYFRHLYHILKYIYQYELRSLEMAKNIRDKSHIKEQCKTYAELAQAQMSAYELALLYYNSLCYPKMAELVRHYGFLENLAVSDLVRPEHYLAGEGFNLKKQRMNPDL